MVTGCYEILSDFTTDVRGSEVLLGGPNEMGDFQKDVCRRMVAALRGPAPLTRCEVDRVRVLRSGRCWVVLRLFIEATSSDFEPDQLGAGCAQVADLLDGPIRELFPNIYVWNVRMIYRAEAAWL